MILYGRRMDYELLLFIFAGALFLVLISKYVSRQILATIFYSIVLPLIFILSILVFTKEKE